MIIKKEQEKKLAAALSVVSNTSLILLKFAAGIISGSISIISEAIHSGSDLLASVITFFSVSESSKPADEEHPFGHGKYEDFTSFIEGALIILAAFYIIYESFKKIFFSTSLEINTNIGIAVMFISIVVNFFVSKYLFKIAKKTFSIALYADGMHLKTDIYSSIAVLIGLFLVKITGNHIFDPLVAIVVALIIFKAGYNICETAKKNLVDTSLDENEISQIKLILSKHVGKEVKAIKKLRTRKTGLKKNIEITLIVEKNMPIGISHEICDKIEDEIEYELKNTEISIHLEPNI